VTGPDFSHLKALVIDDNEHMRILLRSMLTALGIKHILEAGDGGSGFEATRLKSPDFVVTDLSMKPVDGIEYTRMIRMRPDSPNAYLPIIMVTGHTELIHVTAARDAGVTEFLAKPITPQNLAKRVTEIVENPRPFVRCENYFGPNRRRRRDPNFRGPWRRAEDFDDEIAIQ
jgi:CheY-like chemotaxis protein